MRGLQRYKVQQMTRGESAACTQRTAGRKGVTLSDAAAERHAVRTHRRQLGASPLLIAELLVGA